MSSESLHVVFREDVGFSFDGFDAVIPPEEDWPRLGSILQSHNEIDSKYTLTPKLWEYLQAYRAKHEKAGNGFGYSLFGPEGVTRTLSARYHKDGSEILIEQKGTRPRRLTPTECARLMGFEYGSRKWDISAVSDTQAYWQRIRAGCFLGYRPSKQSGGGTWLARVYDADAREYKRKPLGDFGALLPRERFTSAKAEAEAFAELIESGGYTDRRIETVEEACRAYAAGKPDAEGRFKRHVYGDVIAKLKLDKLRRHHLRDWRLRLEQRPALVSRSKTGPERSRARSRSAINRDMVPLRAALFKVLAPGAPGTEAAWQEALTPIKNADKQRTLYLDASQRRALLRHVTEEAASFVEALCLLPLRPGAMAALLVRDFDARTRELTIGKDKSGRPRRIIIPARAAELMKAQSKDKLPSTPIFTRGNGKVWSRDYWNQPMAAAAARANLPPITAYTLRHSVLTDLVNGGLPILTVAQISDTSIEMIERHYGHLNQAAAEQALAALSF